MGALEGQYMKKYGVLPKLSEQQLIDCGKAYDLKGCDGGWQPSAFKYVRDMRQSGNTPQLKKYGLLNETDYKYLTKVHEQFRI